MKCFGYILYLIPLFLLLPSIILRFSSIEPIHRGYYCMDTSIQYPYVEYQTVPLYLCLLIWTILTILHLSIAIIAKKSWKIFIDAGSKLVLGFCICMLITDVSKFSIGRLRPYFMTVCNSDLDNLCYGISVTEMQQTEDNETYYFPELHHQRYVSEENTCSPSLDPSVLKEARLSFFSGHASTSFYTAFYLANFSEIYISPWILKTLLQLLSVLMAFWISLTRISDYMHHPEDVIVGAIIGTMCAFFMNKCRPLLQLPSQSKPIKEETPLTNIQLNQDK